MAVLRYLNAQDLWNVKSVSSGLRQLALPLLWHSIDDHHRWVKCMFAYMLRDITDNGEALKVSYRVFAQRFNYLTF